MRQLVRATPGVCKRCKYHMNFGAATGTNFKPACNYMSIMGHSRMYKDGKELYDKEFCDKYEPGDSVMIRKQFDFSLHTPDEYECYKFARIKKERGFQNDV